jgi:hypothetical protein
LQMGSGVATGSHQSLWGVSSLRKASALEKASIKWAVCQLADQDIHYLPEVFNKHSFRLANIKAYVDFTDWPIQICNFDEIPVRISRPVCSSVHPTRARSARISKGGKWLHLPYPMHFDISLFGQQASVKKEEPRPEKEEPRPERATTRERRATTPLAQSKKQ